MRSLMQRFFNAIEGERQYQAKKFGGGTEEGLDRTDDEKNDTHSFVSYIAHYSTKWFNGGFGPWDEITLRAFQISMVKAATVAYAGYAWAERKVASLQPVVTQAPTEDDPLRVGDVVVRGDQRATVTQVADSGDLVEITWFDSDRVLHGAVVRPDTLQRAPAEDDHKVGDPAHTALENPNAEG